MNEEDKIKVLIIDDEEPARSIIRHYLTRHNTVQIVGECSDGFCGLIAIRDLNPDLIFLDIQMPKLTGFELLEVLEEKPEIIFTTAFDEYAIKAFEMNAVDYLLKPFSEKRFDDAFEKAVARISRGAELSSNIQKLATGETEGLPALNRIVIRKGNAISFIAVRNIRYMMAEDDYVMIFHTGGKALKEQTMKYYEKKLPENEFVRIHRSCIVAIEQISRIEPYGKNTYVAILKDGESLPVSRSGYKKLKERLSI
ncbi:MAG: LytTR family transcriptional regulator DNA-binding domain-containing protein [Bacteroidales bacterium]|nr:LytTR family transcriptional regulator DNA-binding domain-containing protein [Bacteroidales bacterium]